MTTIKARFCPSPTGLVHLGNIRTAIFNDLFVRKHKGIFLLRIEDTDKARSDEQYTKALMEDMLWLDLKWNEGPEVGGENGPYWQSQRQDIYDSYYHKLEDSGRAYPCFCSEQELAIARKVQLSSGRPPRYMGTCRNLTKAEIAEKIAQGLVPTLRFRVPDNEEVIFTDLVRGEQRFATNDIGDFIIRRTDGTSPFMFCNAIDDAMMKVTHVLRGEDHLTNTPRQIMILLALKLHVPHYGHISLIVGPDGSPLSKRHGSRNIQQLRAEGFIPAGIVNYLARLGHHYVDDKGFMSLAELADNFSVDSLGKAPARFDEHQMLHWQKEAVMRLNHDELWQWLGKNVHAIVPANKKELFLQTIAPNVVFPVDGEHWAKILFADKLHYNDEAKAILHSAGKSFFDVAYELVQAGTLDYATFTNALKERSGLKGKALFMPLRVALTSEPHGPELAPVFQLLGKENILPRLKEAQQVS